MIEGESDYNNMMTIQKVAGRIRDIVEANQFNNLIFQESTARIVEVENGTIWVLEGLNKFKVCHGIKGHV